MLPRTIFLMLGYPGSGKTTAARCLEALTGAVHLWADQRRHKYFEQPHFTTEENICLYDALNREVEQLLAENKSVIYDTSFNYYNDRQRLQAIASIHHAQTIVVHVVTPKNVALQRATNGAHMQSTRILGDMSIKDFERLCAALEEPQPHEVTLKLDGQQMTQEYVREVLQITKILTA